MHEVQSPFSVLLSCCKDNRQRAGQTQRLHRCLSMVRGSPSLHTPAASPAEAVLVVRGSPSLHTPAASPAEAVLAVAGTRPYSDMATGSCPDRATAGRCPTVEWPPIAARVRATSVPACCVAHDHRPSPGVGQSRPMASAYGLGFFPQLSGCRIRPQPCRSPESWPWQPVRVGRSSPACWLQGR